MSCINLNNIDEALSCVDQDNMGGIVPKLIYGYWDEVATWPDWPAPTSQSSLALDAAGAITGDLVMATGKRAYTLEFSDNVGSFSISPQGEQGGISFLYSLTFISKRVRKLILGFLNASKNRKMFFIVQDNNGVYYLMGDKRRGALLQAGDGAVTGTATTDQNQTTCVFNYVSPRALAYEGDVDDILSATNAAVPQS